MRQADIIQALESNQPFRDLPQVSVEKLGPVKDGPLDIEMTLNAGGKKILVYAEIKNLCTPMTVAQIAPWLAKLKQLQPGVAVALVCPNLSPEAQRICLDNQVDFIDMAGNVSISVPGEFYLQRVRMKPISVRNGPVLRDPFAGRGSRVLRVLLERPDTWRLSKIAEELLAETRRAGRNGLDFQISMASISKVLASLAEELLVRRRDAAVLVPEPKRLLLRWANKYRERYRWRMRSSFKCPNPFGPDLQDIRKGLQQGLRPAGQVLITGAAAAGLVAPYVDLEEIELLVARQAVPGIRELASGPSRGPGLRVIIPYDDGVFMYAKESDVLNVASDIQIFLDLYGRGGRDLKQAEYFLSTAIEPRWRRV